MNARFFVFLIIILVVFLLVAGIILLVRWIVRSTETNQKSQYGQAPVVYSAQKVFCPDCGKEYIGDITECEQHHYGKSGLL